MGFRFLLRGIWWCVLALVAVGALRGADDAAKFSPPEAWPVAGIRAAMGDASPQVRRHAITCCVQRRWVGQCLKLEELMLLLLKEPDEWVRREAEEALGMLGRETEPEVLARVLPLLRSADRQKQLCAVNVLGWMGNAAAPCAGELLPLLKDIDLELRRRVVEVLGEMEAGAQHGVAQALLPLLHDADKAIPLKAVDALGKLGADAASVAVPALLPLLKEHLSVVRLHLDTALKQLLQNAAPEVAKQLLPLLKDADDEVRLHALAALEMMARQAAPYARDVVPLLQDTHNDVRNLAMAALGKMGGAAAPEVLPALLPLIHVSDIHVQRHALEALGEMGRDVAPQVVPHLLPLLKSPEKDVQFAVLMAFGHMGAAATPYAKELLPLLQSSERRVNFMAAHVLARLGPEAARLALPVLLLPLKDSVKVDKLYVIDELEELGPVAAPVAKELLPLLLGPDRELQCRAAGALRQMGEEVVSAVVPELLPLLKDSDAEVRRNAVAALGCLGKAAAPMAVKELLPLLKFSELGVKIHAVMALGEMGDAAAPAVVPALLPLLDDSDGLVKRTVLKVLEKLGPAVAPCIKEPLPLLKHPWVEVRSMATAALDLFGNANHDPAWQCAALAATADSSARHAEELRFHLYLWSGRDADLLLSVRWLGKPFADPMPEKGLGVAEQQAVLGMLLKLWPASAAHPALRREMAGRVGDVARGITTAPDKKVVALLGKLDAELKADAVEDSKEGSAKARVEVQRALAASSLNEL